MALIVAAAIIRDGRLLAARRDRGPFEGQWEFPGGKVESGEADHEALLRELAEELGCTGEVGEQIGGEWPLSGGHTMHVYRVTLAATAEPRCLDGHDRMLWTCRSEAASLRWIPADLPILDEVATLLCP